MAEATRNPLKIGLLYSPCPNAQVAAQIAAALVEGKFVACANLGPMDSIYHWQGALHREHEVLLIAKTTLKSLATAAAELERLHPYEIPCVLSIEVQANERYAHWVATAVGEKSEGKR